MKVWITLGGYWLAQGNGPVRLILAEGGTRQEAMLNWTSQYREQRREPCDIAH